MEEEMRPQRIPNTDSIEELSKFWDTHDLTDFEDQLEEVRAPVCICGITGGKLGAKTVVVLAFKFDQ